MENENFHEPVLVREVIDLLHIKKDSKVIDATLGLCGHTIEFIRLGAKVLGIDTDKESLKIADEKLKLACPGEYSMVPTPFKLINGNFRDIDTIAKENGFTEPDAILADLGVSTYQLTSKTRGLSFQNRDTGLDMRMDRESNKVKASDLLNLLRHDQLMEMFLDVMPFHEAANLVKNIDRYRKAGNKFETVGDLLDLIPKKSGKLNSGTLPFMALRMAVNSERENLADFLPKAFSVLKIGGFLGVISFHSGEDKLVKDFFKKKESSLEGILQKPEVVKPGLNELHRNPRSRSAKLRVIYKKQNNA